uniref:uncharacterized protein LOC122591981 n=1 Tax=Erigeron canadensis TaxID=72917 RepID=UPI001CB950B5|nr:uncharacterized protein LOC122591981 [Erigeron canadensis]
MAKLTLLALAFTALVAFATAHTTIVTTIVEDENPFSQSPRCRQKLQMQRLDKCQMYLQQGQSPYVSEVQIGLRKGQHQLEQQCCQQLQNVESQCQCEAVQQVLEDAQRMQGQQQGQFGFQQQQMEQKAQRLPQQCRLQVREQECQIRGSSGGFSNPQQQCSRVQGQSFNQCQRFIQEAQRSSPRMMVSRQSQQLQQQLQQCCNELENMQRECQCEAFEEVYRQAVQQQQGGRQQQPWQQGGQQQHQQRPQWQQGSQQMIGQAMETIRNQCNIEVQQCRGWLRGCAKDATESGLLLPRAHYLQVVVVMPEPTTVSAMAKLTLLALAFTALVAFATAHTTIVTTTIEDENPIAQVPMCRQRLQSQRLDKCHLYLQQGQIPYDELISRGQFQPGQIQGQQQLQQQCCQQLQNVDRQCQCEAVKQVFEQSRQIVQGQQQHQQGQFGSQRQLEQQLEQKAQRLPQQCRLQVREQECQIRGSSGGFSNPQQQCSRVQGQSFNQCQRFIQQAQQESGSLMRISRQSQQLQQQLQQCCNELENVQRDCQCEAFEEVYRQAVQQQQGGRQQQQRPWQQQGGQQRPWQQQGGQHQQQPWQQQGGQQQIGQAMQAIRDQCNIEVQQCRVPSAMF